MTMDIAQASTAMQQAQVQQQVSMSTLKAGLESEAAMAQGMNDMLTDVSDMSQQVAQDPAVGQTVNVMA